ncbi:MAG: HIT domain-containing protein [Spirochaetales bacterium]|nr:HIT domain-containing protein [Spirochaetales bacterium]
MHLSDQYFLCFNKITYVRGEKPPGCILCSIRDKEPHVVDLSVYRDDFFIVCVNLYPYNPGHIIIFPLRHIEDIRDYNAQEEKRFTLLKKEFLNILDQLYTPSGYNIGYNMKKSAGASIDHLHIHIIPRYPAETGIVDLIAGKRILIENPMDTTMKIKKAAVYLKNL